MVRVARGWPDLPNSVSDDAGTVQHELESLGGCGCCRRRHSRRRSLLRPGDRFGDGLGIAVSALDELVEVFVEEQEGNRDHDLLEREAGPDDVPDRAEEE